MNNDDAIDRSLTSGGLRSAQYSKTLSEELLNIGMPRPTKNISSLWEVLIDLGNRLVEDGVLAVYKCNSYMYHGLFILGSDRPAGGGREEGEEA